MRRILFHAPFRSECYLLGFFGGGGCVLLILFAWGFCLLVFISFPTIDP